MKMSKIFKVTFLIILILSPYIVQGQQNADSRQSNRLALDPTVRYGRLDNGLTYYIRPNKLVSNKADFHLALNVGSMQEENLQLGFVHTLQHLALYSSKNFPKPYSIRGFLERIGLTITDNIVFRTGFDESLYSLTNVPTMRQNVIDSCLLVLHDWAAFLSLEAESIEKARDEMRNEWKTRHPLNIRLLEQQLPVMYPECKYGVRIPTGKIGMIENFERNELIDFYKKWFRPDLQALVIVGDVDADKIEERIIKFFSALRKPVKSEPKDLFTVPDNQIPLISIASDKELKNTTLTVYYKFDNLPFKLKGTIPDLIDNYMRAIINQIMKERFAKILKETNTPFITVEAQEENYYIAKTKGAWVVRATIKENQLKTAMKRLVIETDQLKQLGISEEEYKRAKEIILKEYEIAYKNKEKQQNRDLSTKYINHFINGDYALGIELEYDLIKQFNPIIDEEAINNSIKNIFKDDNKITNIVISVTVPENEKKIYPTESEIADFYVEVLNDLRSKDEDVPSDLVLVSELPKPGKIISELKDEKFDATVYKLSNGVTVIIKKTALKQGQILMSGISPGGTTLYKDEKDILNLKMINNVIKYNGLGDYTELQIRKFLAQNQINYTAGLSITSEVISGETPSARLKTLFEIIYLHFKGIRTDFETYIAIRESMITQMKEAEKSLEVIFDDSLKNIAHNYDQRTRNLKSWDIPNINYYRLIEMYKERFADASDFIFTFIGDIHIDSIRPLIEQYLATLPTLSRKENADEQMITPFQKGKIKRNFTVKSKIQEANIALIYSGYMPYSLKNIIISQLLKNIIEQLPFEKLIEYGNDISFLFSDVVMDDFPKGRTTIQYLIDSEPEKAGLIIEKLKTELQKLADEGISEETLLKSMNTLIGNQIEAMRGNEYWKNVISNFYSQNFDLHTDFEQILESIKKEDIQLFLKNFLSQGNEIEVVMFQEL